MKISKKRLEDHLEKMLVILRNEFNFDVKTVEKDADTANEMIKLSRSFYNIAILEKDKAESDLVEFCKKDKVQVSRKGQVIIAGQYRSEVELSKVEDTLSEMFDAFYAYLDEAKTGTWEDFFANFKGNKENL